MASTIRILSPVGLPADRRDGNADRVDTLHGTVLGIMSNGWRSFLVGLERFEELALHKYDAAGVVKGLHANASGPAPAETFAEVTKHSQAAIVGLGH